jgi:two-component system phosphate regulon sensor histidine kinase PhoR
MNPNTAAARSDADDPSNILSRVLEATRDCVLVVNSQLRIAHHNAAAEDAFGRGLGGLASRRLSELIRDLDIHQAFRDVLALREPRDVQFEVSAPKRRKFDVRVAPIDLDGDTFAIGFFYETTQLERLETVRQEFLSNISHELRTPLTSILAFVETLEDGGISDQDNNVRFLGVIRRNAERMHSLINDILELSLIESGNVTVEPSDTFLAIAVKEVMARLAAKADERKIDLVNAVPADFVVWADRARLDQMLTNIIDNAIKFNKAGGSVTVGCEALPDRTHITVTDTGEGIAPEHLDRVFERLYRADRSRTRDVGGTGLGLAIVKHLARLHGGGVSVRSTLGSGTSFRIELPVVNGRPL